MLYEQEPKPLTASMLKREMCRLVHQIDWYHPSCEELERIIDVGISEQFVVIAFCNPKAMWMDRIPIQTFCSFPIVKELREPLDYISAKYLVPLAWEACVSRFPKEVLLYWSA